MTTKYSVYIKPKGMWKYSAEFLDRRFPQYFKNGYGCRTY
jgi:hypothetical protein